MNCRAAGWFQADHPAYTLVNQPQPGQMNTQVRPGQRGRKLGRSSGRVRVAWTGAPHQRHALRMEAAAKAANPDSTWRRKAGRKERSPRNASRGPLSVRQPFSDEPMRGEQLGQRMIRSTRPSGVDSKRPCRRWRPQNMHQRRVSRQPGVISVVIQRYPKRLCLSAQLAI